MTPITKPTGKQDSVWLDRLHRLLAAPRPGLKKSEPDPPPARSPVSRRNALAALAGGGATAALATPGAAGAQNNQNNARRVDDASAFVSILVREDTHAKTVRGLLGSRARPRPTFRNLDAPNFEVFAFLSQIFENVGAGAYLGATPFINSRALLAQAGSIGFMEARQAAWLNSAMGNPFSASAFNLNQDRIFEDPLTDDQVSSVVSYFIADLNGGPPPAYDETPSDENDIAILNFALVQEELEQEFYLLNVPKFFGGGAQQRRQQGRR